MSGWLDKVIVPDSKYRGDFLLRDLIVFPLAFAVLIGISLAVLKLIN